MKSGYNSFHIRLGFLHKYFVRNSYTHKKPFAECYIISLPTNLVSLTAVGCQRYILHHRAVAWAIRLQHKEETVKSLKAIFPQMLLLFNTTTK